MPTLHININSIFLQAFYLGGANAKMPLKVVKVLTPVFYYTVKRVKMKPQDVKEEKQ